MAHSAIARVRALVGDPVGDLRNWGTVDGLSQAQFQFARALYVAIPPMSKSFPPGDTAIKAQSGSEVMIAIVAGDKTCARFLAPDFVQRMLGEIERAPL